MLGSDTIKKIKKIIIYVNSLIVLAAGCKLEVDNYKFKKQTEKFTNNFVNDDFLIAAHRGYSSREIENTKKAITLANNTNYVDYIEIDVRMTKDNKFILCHDNNIVNDKNKITNISKTDYDDICDNTYINYSFAKYNNVNTNNNKDLFSKYMYNITPLKKGLNCCKDKKVLLDLKFENNTKEFIDAFIKELNDSNIVTDNIIFQSDDLTALLYFKNIKPEYNIYAIIKNKSNLKYCPLFDGIVVKKNLINEQEIKDTINNGKMVAVWTINDYHEVDNIVDELGTDYKKIIYITDYPDLIALALNNHQNNKVYKKEKN